ncbi:MAG: glycosyltransferase [Verrucomicrobia bacterium]|jgi:glycosyltransferase involved in cell wall biosynthesis|nr:glycosyltransferase [Verrucomicrobiota bacterium]
MSEFPHRSVAIILRTKNRNAFLRRALASVARQTFPDWQLVIVNDGGDATALDDLLRDAYTGEPERLTVLHHAENRGMQPALNAGIESSRSTFICVHDDDDEWEPQFLSTTVAWLEEAGEESLYQGVITHTMEVTEVPGLDGVYREESRRPYIPLEEISLFRLGYENPFPPIAFCYRRRVWEELGGYDPRWDLVGDMEFNFRFLLRHEIGVIAEPLALYRIRKDRKDDREANSVAAKRDQHKRLSIEFKNRLLRGEGSASSAGLGLNLAEFLVEMQWMLDTVFHRSREHGEDLARLEGAFDLTGVEESRYKSLRDALNILVDAARDPSLRQMLEKLWEARKEEQERHDRHSARQEELVAAVGLPGGGEERFRTVREALNLLVDHARDPYVREAVRKLWEAREEEATARSLHNARQEELIASVGLPAEEHDRFKTVREVLNTLHDFATKTRPAKQEDMGEVKERLDRLEQSLRVMREEARQWRFGPFTFGWRRKRPREER